MKISIEAEVLTQYPAAIYRYGANLLRQLAGKFPNLTMEPILSTNEWLVPYDRSLFQQVFHMCASAMQVSRRWRAYEDHPLMRQLLANAQIRQRPQDTLEQSIPNHSTTVK
jgi:hypothetical protein